MADESNIFAQVASAFEVATDTHSNELRKVKNEALRYKEECDKFLTDMANHFESLADTVQAHLNNVHSLMGPLQPLIQQVKQLEKKSTATKQPVKKARKKA